MTTPRENDPLDRYTDKRAGYNKNPEDDSYYPSPEDFEEEPPRPKGPLSRMPARRHFRPAFFLFILFYVASAIYGRYPLGDKLWVSGEAVFYNHEYWRLFTSIATHADFLHLISNALIFLLFGWMLKAYFGMLIFPVVSLIIGVITNLITVAIYDPHIRLIGASGMAYGMVALWIIFYIRYDIDHRLPVRIFRAVGFVMVMLLPSTFNPQTSYMAHAAGFLIGTAAGLALLPFVSVRDPK